MNRFAVTASSWRGLRGELLVRPQDAMARRALRGAVQVPGAATGLQDRLEPEPADRLEDLEEVVLTPDLGAHDVAGFDGIPLVVDLDHRPAFEDEPVLIAVVVVPVERLAGLDLEGSGRGDVRPGRPLLALDALPDVLPARRVEHRVSRASRWRPAETSCTRAGHAGSPPGRRGCRSRSGASVPSPCSRCRGTRPPGCTPRPRRG